MKRKPKFKVGDEVNLPMRIFRVDGRFNPPRYAVEAIALGWVLSDLVAEEELTKREQKGK